MEKISELSLWTKWKRPATVPYPNTWHRFTTTSKNGEIYNLKITDLTPDRFEESMEFTKDYFYPHEPLTIYSKFLDDEVSYHNGLCKQRTVLHQNMSVICVLDEDTPKPEMVGLLKLLVVSKDDDPVPNIPGVLMRKKTNLMKEVMKNHDLFATFGIDKIVKDFGLCVKSEYRGLNIGYNMLATIEKIAIAFSIKASALTCNSIQSQKIADKVGYRLINEIAYNEFKDEQGQVPFPVEGTKFLKFVAIEYA